MKIVFISFEFPPHINGGLGRFAEHFSGQMIKQQHQLWVLTYNPGNLPRESNSRSLHVFRPVMKSMQFKYPERRSWPLTLLCVALQLIHFNISSYFLLRRLRKQIKFDVITIHDWMSSITGILCALTMRTPLVFHVHNTENTMTTWGKARDPLKIVAVCERLLAGLAQQIIVPSSKMQELLVQNGWDSRKIRVVHHGYCQEPVFTADSLLQQAQKIKALQTRLNITADQPVLVFVGRLAIAKGVFHLIRALPHVIKEAGNIKLIIVGRGDHPTERDIQQLVSALQLEDNIHIYYRFLDKQAVETHYALADVCVFPSIYEPFGLVALEAMAAGKPTVLGSGFSEIFCGLAEDPVALRVANDKPESLAGAIITLLKMPASDRHSMGEKARQYVFKNFSWDKAIAETISIYSQLTKDATGR